MSGFSHGIFGTFLGCLTGIIWFLLVLKGYISNFFGLIGLGGGLAHILNIIIAVIGFLSFLLFGLCVFKKAYHLCK